MVKRNLAGGSRQEGQVIFVFRVAATVGFVSTYEVYKLFRIALCGIIPGTWYTVCVELWLSLRPGTCRGTQLPGTGTHLPVLQYTEVLYLIRHFFVVMHTILGTQYTWKPRPGMR